MLWSVQVQGFGLIHHLELAFGPGLNLISGETGAGKSMLIDAMLMVSGGRASADLIQTGAEQATVDAVFRVGNCPGVAAKLAELGIATGDDQVVMSREINRGGRNICRVNGRPVPAAVAREVAALLVNLHGQHEHQSLLEPARHRALLDAYGGRTHQDLADETRSAYARLRDLEGRLAAVSQSARDRAQRQDLWQFQLNEIEAARIAPGEDQALREERARLVNAEKLARAAGLAYALIFGGQAHEAYDGAGPERGSGRRAGGPGGAGGPGSGGPGARDALAVALGELELASGLDRGLEAPVEMLRTVVYTLDDLGREIREYREGLESDPARLEQLQSRLEHLASLRRKYADTLEGVLEHAALLRRQLAELAAGEEIASGLEAEISSARQTLGQLALRLSQARRALARRLEAQVESELHGLGMPKAVFRVDVSRGQSPGPHGLDEVEFLLSPNPGEAPRRLSRAASGGELSRTMLALQTVLSLSEHAPVLIFDEVDSGIGGRTANAVGLRLAALARAHQVLCVTHLPQVAAFADHHFVVHKESTAEATRVLVHEVAGDARLGELARMLGADAGATAAIEHARDLLRRSSESLTAHLPSIPSYPT